MKLTPSQQQGMLDFKEFMLNPKKEIATISGSAGVGKSFFIDQCLANIDSINNRQAYMGNHPITDIAICATTNKAAKVLKDLPHGNEDTCTIFSRLGLRLARNYKTGNEFITKGRNYQSKSIRNTLMIVDEASYSDSKLEKYILDSLLDSKLLLVGDECQLTSVAEPNFNIFGAKYINTKISLTENMRFNPNSPLGQLNAQLREWVYNQDLQPTIVPNGTDVIFADDSNIHQHIENAFKLNMYGDTRVIAYTNATCVNYNTYVRKLLGFSELPSVGERLIVATAFTPNSGRNAQYVDAELIVQEVDPTKVTIMDIDGINIVTNKGSYTVPYDYHQYKQKLNAAAKESNWNDFYAIKDTFLDARPDYARTSHKAQGSTHDTVIIDLHDLLTMQDKNQLIRAIYVAVSRARQKVILYGYPD